MKIIYKVGDLLECDETYIAHGCNTRGLMGAGVALAIHRKYPQVFNQYVKYGRGFGFKHGECITADTMNGKVVLNLITQTFEYKDRNLNYESMYTCLENVNHLMAHSRGTASTSYVKVAMPKIGAGLAGGDWGIIERMIQITSTNYQPVVYTLE